MNPTKADLRALQVLESADEMLRCTQVGSRLWGKQGRRVNWQSYARSAGKVLKRLVRAGLADTSGWRYSDILQDWRPPRYMITAEGSRVLREANGLKISPAAGPREKEQTLDTQN